MTDEEAELIAQQIELYRRQARWEAPKAIAAVLAAIGIFMGAVLVVSHCWHPEPQTITVRLAGPIVVQHGVAP